MGRCELSQRSYKALKSVLSANNVKIPTYDKLMDFINKLNVGEIVPLNCGGCSPNCFGYGCDIANTLQDIVNTKKLFSKFVFLSEAIISSTIPYIKG